MQLSRSECPQKSNTPLHGIQEVKEIDMQISCVIEGYYHNALYLVYYSYSNGQVWAENISQPSALIADWELENGDHWFKLHMWRGRMRACLLSPSGSSCNLNIKLSSSIFDVSTIAVESRIWDPLVLCYKKKRDSSTHQTPLYYLWLHGAARRVISVMRRETLQEQPLASFKSRE